MAIDEMNLLLTIPVNAAGLICKAKFLDDDGPNEAGAYYSAADLHWAFDDFSFYNDGFYQDHQELIGQEAKEYPVIITIPEMTFEADLHVISVRTGDGIAKGGEMQMELAVDSKHMKRSDVRKAREDFLKYIPEGDHYDDIYVLTEKGKQEIGSMLNEDWET